MRIADQLLDDEGRIDEDRWAAAQASTESVGRCHEDCPRDVYAEATDGAWGNRFYVASCARGHEAVIPATRVVRKPAARVLVTAGGVSEAYLAAGRERDAAILGERD